MPITTLHINNIGSPPDDPLVLLPGTLFIPDPAVHPPPWHCIAGTQAAGFGNSQNLSGLTTPFIDLANNGFLCLAHFVRLTTNQLPNQTTSGRWHQQTDDCKLGQIFCRIQLPLMGYSITGFVGSLGGSGSAHHSLYMAIDGTTGVDRSDAAICMSPPTDLSDSESDVTPSVTHIIQTYGDSTDSATLLARSPISLSGLPTARPIIAFVGDHETHGYMPHSMLTHLDAAIAAAGTLRYVSVTNTGAAAVHSFAMWPFVGDSIIVPWILNEAAIWSPSPPPDKLHLPIFTPSTSPDSDIDVSIDCSDTGAHLFYTLGENPDPPTHVGDVPTGDTIRIGSNSGNVNTGDGISFIKAIAFEDGFIDSDLAVSGQYGSPPVPPPEPVEFSRPVSPRPIPMRGPIKKARSRLGVGIMYLTKSLRVGNPPHDLSQDASWTIDAVNGVALRSVWARICASRGSYDWSFFDQGVALAKQYGKTLSLFVNAGTDCPPWIYGLGAYQFNVTLDTEALDASMNGLTLPQASIKVDDIANVVDPPGTIYVTTDAGVQVVSYTGLNNSTNTYTGCTGGTGLMHTGGQVLYKLPMPIIWEPIFQFYWFEFLNAFAARYANISPPLAYVVMGGLGRHEETFYVTTAADQAELDVLAAAGVNGSQTYATGMDAWVAGAKSVVSQYWNVFRNVPFVCGTGAPSPADPAGTDALQALIDYGSTQYRGHFGLKANGLALNGPSNGSIGMTQVNALSGFSLVGYQFGDAVAPPPGQNATMQAILNRGLTNGAHVIEVFGTQDCEDESQWPLLTQAGINMLNNSRDPLNLVPT